jgi:hypothetical protein
MTYLNSTVLSTMPKIWSREMDKNMKPKQLFRQMGKTLADEIKSVGVEYTRSRFDRTPVQPYERGAGGVTDHRNSTVETVLKVDQQVAYSIVVNDLDELQAKPELRNTFAADSIQDLSNDMDGVFAYEAAFSAANVVNNDDLTGLSTGLPIALNVNNVFKVHSIGKMKLANRAVPTSNLAFASSPEFIQVIEEVNGSRETDYGDKVTKDGVTYDGRVFKQNGVNVYETLNYAVTEVLNMATNPTDGDTITFVLNNVFEDTPVTYTVTFVASIGTTPGNVLIGTTVDATRTNLADHLANLRETTAQYVGFPRTSPVYWAARKIKAINQTANNRVVFRKAQGRFTSVSSSLTAVADGFSATLRCQNLFLTIPGATSTVVQKEPHMQIEKVQGDFEYRVHGYALHGHKTFAEDAKKIVRYDIAL